MIKQIFGKLPRKPSKSLNNDSNGEGAVNSYYAPNPSASASRLPNGTLAPNSNKNIQAGPFPPSGVVVYEALPSFRDVPISEKPNLFLQKLTMCCVVFDFRDPSKNLKGKEIKRQTLLELVDYVASVGAKFNEAAIQELTKMVAVNLFSTFPSAYNES